MKTIIEPYLLAADPRYPEKGEAIISTIDPISILPVSEGKHYPDGKHFKHFEHNGRSFTIEVHHLFTTNMAGLDSNVGNEIIDVLLNCAWRWYVKAKGI